MIKEQRQYRLYPTDNDGLPVPQLNLDDEGLPIPVPVKKKGVESVLGAASKIASMFGGNGSSPTTSKLKTEEKTGFEDALPPTPEDELRIAKEKKALIKPLGDVGINLDHDDPFGELVKPSIETVQKGFLSSGMDKPKVSESTKQLQNLKTPIKKEVGITPEQEVHIAANNIDLTLKAMDKAFPDGKVAEEYLQRRLEKEGTLPENNATVNYALHKAQELEDWNKRLTENPDLTQVAVDIVRGNDENLDKQISTLEQGRFAGSPDLEARKKEVKEAGFYYDNMLPGEQIGAYVDQLIHDPNTKLIAEKNPAVKEQMDYLLNGGLYERFPAYGKNKILNEVSQEYERRKNAWVFDPGSPYKDKVLNDIADQLYAGQPQLKKLVDENFRDNWTGKIDNPTLTSRFAEGFTHTAKEQAASLYDFIGQGASRQDRIYKELQNQYGHVSAGETGIKKDFGNASNFAGMLTEMALLGRGMGATKVISPSAIRVAIPATTFYDTQKTLFTMGYPDQPAIAEAGATLSTLAFTFAYKAFPSEKLAAAVAKKMQPEIGVVLSSLDKGAVSAAERATFLSKLKDVTVGTLGKTAEGTSQMVALSMGQNAFNAATGMTEKTQQKYEQDPVVTARNMAIGLLAPSLIQSFGNVGAAGRNLNTMAQFPMRHINGLDKMLQENVINKEQYAQKKSDIELLSTVKKKLVEDGIDDKNHSRALVEALSAKHAKEKIESSPADYMVRNQKENLKEHQEVLDRILAGEDADTIVTEKQQKAIDEKDKNDTEFERLTVDRELALKKIDAKIEETDGRESEANRIKLQELKEEKKRVNEDYDKKLSKLKPPEPLTPEQEVIKKALDSGKLKGSNADMAKLALSDANNVQPFLDMVREQAFNEIAPDATTKEKTLAKAKEDFGDELISASKPKTEAPPTTTNTEEVGDVKGGEKVGGIPKAIDEKSAVESQQWINNLFSLPDYTRIKDKDGNVYEVSNNGLRKLTLDENGKVIDKEKIYNNKRNEDGSYKSSQGIPDFFRDGYEVIPESSTPSPTVREGEQVKTENENIQTNIESPESKPPIEGGGEEKLASEAAQGTGEPPKTGEKAPISEGEGDIGGITHAANEIRRKDRLLPEYEKTPQTFEQWNNEAEKAIKEGYDVEKLMDEIEAGKDPNPVENAIRKIYIATLDAEIAKNPTDALLAKQKRFVEIGDLANSRAGRNLVSLKGENSPLSSISDFYVAKMEAAGVDKLTETQKKETKEAFDKVQKADENATAAMEAYRQEIAKLKAENELLKQKKTTPKKSEKKDYAAERKEIIGDILLSFSKASGEGASFLGAKELTALASGVIKLSKNIAEEFGHNLKEVVSRVYEELKDKIKGLEEKHIRDIIAGEYNEKKPTRNELAAKWRDLRDEAHYIGKLEKLLNGEEPKNEKAKVKRNREITALREKIKDVQSFEGDIAKQQEALVRAKATGAKEVSKELTKAEREEAKKDADALKKKIKEEKDEIKKADLEAKLIEKELKYRSKEEIALQQIKTRNEKETAKIKERIAKGDFEVKKKLPFLEDPEMQRKFPAQYKAALDAIVKREDARHEFDIALLKDQMAKRGLAKKYVVDLAGDILGTTRALVTGIDASGIGIQNLMAMVAHPRSAAKALPASFGDFISAKNQERWLASVHSSKLFPLAKRFGLDITEPQSLKSSEREEIFTHNLLDRRIRFKGKDGKEKTFVISKYTTKPFERIFTGLGNRMRWNLWQRGVDKLYEDGFTPEKNPEEFESLAKVLNTETGRGTLHPSIKKGYDFWSSIIWSPRLMASRLNILGLGDLFNAPFGKKGYYGGLTPRMREYAIKDFAKFVVFGSTMMALAGISFADDTDIDPNSATFGTFTANGKRYNMWGGFTQYVRLVAALGMGGENKGGEWKSSNQLKTGLRFIWGKTTPVVGTSIALLNKDSKDYMGVPVTTKGAIENLTVPLSIRGIIKGVKKEGLGSIVWTGVPSFVGMNVAYESDFAKPISAEDLKDPTFKIFSDKGLRFPEFDPERIQTKEVNGKVTEHLSDYPKETQDKYIAAKKKYFKEELKSLKNGDYQVYRDSNGTVHIESDNVDVSEMKYVPFKDLTKEDIQYLSGTYFSGNSTKKAKADVFPKE